MKQCVPAEIEKRNRGSPRSVSTSLMSGNSSLRLVHELCVAADGGGDFYGLTRVHPAGAKNRKREKLVTHKLSIIILLKTFFYFELFLSRM